MKIDYKTLLVYAVMGKGTGDIDNSVKMQEQGLAVSTGNQWNENWEWVKDELEKLSIEQLEAMFLTQELLPMAGNQTSASITITDVHDTNGPGIEVKADFEPPLNMEDPKFKPKPSAIYILKLADMIKEL